MLEPRRLEVVRFPAGVRNSSYPLELPLFLAAVVLGLSFGMLASPLGGVAVFILFLCVGLTWMDGDPPALAFCIAYQWMFVVTGYFHQLLTGNYPSLLFVGNLDGAVGLSLLGFFFLVLGLRLSDPLMPNWVLDRRDGLVSQGDDYDIQRLFFLVLAVYSLNYLGDISPRLFFSAMAQILERILEFRAVLLFALIATILRKNRGHAYGVIAFLFALTPQFASAQSVFKEFFFLLLLALLSFWRPWSPDPAVRRDSRTVATLTLLIVLGLGCMGVAWEGAIKPIWRRAYRAGEIDGTTTERVTEFSATVAEAAGGFDLGHSVTDLAGRLSSGVGYFSHVLEHVPAIVPHEGGSLTMRAVRHVVQPRVIFPDKADLGVDSWLVRIYAGFDVAGEELETSVGLTYMAQFYIDFGSIGMMLALLVYGALLGVLYRCLLIVAPSHTLFAGSVVAILLNHFTSYEGEIAKLLGGMIQSFVIFALLLLVVGPALHRFLERPAATAPTRPARPRPAGIASRPGLRR